MPCMQRRWNIKAGKQRTGVMKQHKLEPFRFSGRRRWWKVNLRFRAPAEQVSFPRRAIARSR